MTADGNEQESGGIFQFNYVTLIATDFFDGNRLATILNIIIRQRQPHIKHSSQLLLNRQFDPTLFSAPVSRRCQNHAGGRSEGFRTGIVHVFFQRSNDLNEFTTLAKMDPWNQTVINQNEKRYVSSDVPRKM